MAVALDVLLQRLPIHCWDAVGGCGHGRAVDAGHDSGGCQVVQPTGASLEFCPSLQLLLLLLVPATSSTQSVLYYVTSVRMPRLHLPARYE